MPTPLHRIRVRTLIVLATALGLSVPVFAATGLSRYAFDGDAPLADAHYLASWAQALERARAQAPLLAACEANADACPPHLRAWRHVMQNARRLEPERRIELTNRFVNRRAWRVERRSADDWRTLVEFLDRGGDCEDFAFAKYLLLRDLGFAADDLRVVIAIDRVSRDFHALVAVRQDGKTHLLDVTGGTYGPRALPTYRFLYAVNESSVWDHTRTADLDAFRARAARLDARTFAPEEDVP